MSRTAHPPPRRLEQALPNLAAWAAHFEKAEIPVLGDTTAAIEAMRLNEDAVDAHLISEQVDADPLLTVKLLAHVATLHSTRRTTDTETTTEALVLLGISPFFRAFGPQPTVEDDLCDMPAALEGLRGSIRRAHRAADLAQGFAVQRQDPDVAVIREAALLHDFAHMLLWCHAPRLALQLSHSELDDPVAAQRQVLGIDLAALQQALVRAWHLPELLLQLADERHAASSQVRNVTLAVRLARHPLPRWNASELTSGLEQDLQQLSRLLGLAREPTLDLLRSLGD